MLKDQDSVSAVSWEQLMLADKGPVEDDCKSRLELETEELS